MNKNKPIDFENHQSETKIVGRLKSEHQQLLDPTFDDKKLNRIDWIIAKQVDISLIDSKSTFGIKNNSHFD
jgi:hypothetical protein